jgi:tetratricopeptide (TPR) repeat protein
VAVPHLHEAFVNRQGAGTRLVTTQASYLLTALVDHIGTRDCVLEATADAESLHRHAPELLATRGPLAPLGVVTTAPFELDESSQPDTSRHTLLADAFRATDARARLELCVRALNQGRTAAALVATASVCMEVNDLDAAARDLDEALGLAPDWAAAHFERGKAWLRLDDMEQACRSFQMAAERLPRFGAAWANLGATLGELDRPDEALQAFSTALTCDPESAQIHNNIGVVSRELGKLGESEVAFRRVLDLAPDLAFGYYNLGHTLFLQGRYQAALSAYAEGQRRDPERNPVQATRLAMCRLATGDATGAVADLQQATNGLPSEYRQQLLADTQAIAWALLTHRPDLSGWPTVNDWLTRAQSR